MTTYLFAFLAKKRLTVLLVFLILPLSYGIAWMILSQWSFYQISKILSSTVRPYMAIDTSQFIRSGFPFAISWRVSSLKILSPLIDGKLLLKFSNISFGVSAFNPTTLNTNADGIHLTLINRRDESLWKFQSKQFQVKIVKKNSHRVELFFELEDVKLLKQEGTKLDPNWEEYVASNNLVVNVQQVSSKETTTQKSTANILADIDDIKLRSSPLNNFKNVNKGHLNLAVIGDLDAWRISDIVDWRDDGGIIEIKNMKVDASPINLEMNGTVSLDQELKPIGAGTVLVYGAEEIINEKIVAGDMSRTEGLMAQLALSLLPSKKNSSGKLSIQIPITAQEGKLRVGPFLITELFSIVR